MFYRIAILTALLLGSSQAIAQEQKLGSFNFIYPNRVDPSLLTNHFGFAQSFGSDRADKNNYLSLGEVADVSLKLHEYVGVYSSLKVGFSLSGNTKTPRFSGEGSYLAQGGLSLKVFRSEESERQLIFNVKFLQAKYISAGVDASNIAFDEDYYKSFQGKDKSEIDLNKIIAHGKTDLKSNLDRSVFSGTENISLGGFGLALSQSFNDNFGLQSSIDLMAGNSNGGFVAHHVIVSDLKAAVIFNLRPLVPIALQTELDQEARWHEHGSYGLFQSAYYNNASNFSVGLTLGKMFFIADSSHVVGNLSARYYF